MLSDLRILCVCLLFCLTVGCGPETASVKGKVTVDGQPVSGGQIVFSPNTNEAAGPNATGEIQPDGSFELSAVIGEHTVTLVNASGIESDKNEEDDEEADDEEMSAVVNSLVSTATVKSGENDLTIEIAGNTPGSQRAGGRR